MGAIPETARWQARPRRPPVGRPWAGRSRFARLMKFGLALIAAALIAVVVGWPGDATRDDGFRLASIFRQGDQVDEPGMVNARYVGTDGHKRPFVITAERASPVADDPDTIVLNALQADITLDNGAWLALSAKSGLFRRDLEILELHGPVSLFSDDGYEFNAESVKLDISEGKIESDRPVRGQGPLGLLDARAFHLADEGKRLVFSGGVKVVLFPGKRR